MENPKLLGPGYFYEIVFMYECALKKTKKEDDM